MTHRGTRARKALMAAAGAVLIGVLAQPAIASASPGSTGSPDSAGSPSSSDSSGSSQEVAATPVETVEAYAPIEVGPDYLMALLPEDAPNYVFSGVEDFDRALEWAKGSGGVPLKPSKISGDFRLEPDFAVLGGGWRIDGAPSRIAAEVRSGDEVETVEAKLVQLEGEEGWGGYYFEGTIPVGGDVDSVTVRAYDAEGQVFDEVLVENNEEGGVGQESPGTGSAFGTHRIAN
ncbi:hypothetical protein GCM10022227_20600 [Streptomyces sedi]